MKRKDKCVTSILTINFWFVDGLLPKKEVIEVCQLLV